MGGLDTGAIPPPKFIRGYKQLPVASFHLRDVDMTTTIVDARIAGSGIAGPGLSM